MADGRLVIGTRRYSSWSLRGWLAVRLAGLDVAVVSIPIAGAGPGGTPALRELTPTMLVPYLEHAGARVWESLSICEYCAEQGPGLWPADRAVRATLRSVATEMQGGFPALRRAYPMNLGRVASAAARAARDTPEALADLVRVEAVWATALALTGGPFLHGAVMGVADVMYAPVVTRVLTWGLPVAAAGYVDAVRAQPRVAEWYAEAAAEPAASRLPHYEALLDDPAVAGVA